MNPISERFKDRFAVVLTVLVVGIFALFGAGTYLTVISHNGDLHRIAVLDQKVYQLEKQQAAEHKADAEQKAQLAKDVKAVAVYAAQLTAELSANHNTSYSDQQAICAAIPGCHLPSQGSP